MTYRNTSSQHRLLATVGKVVGGCLLIVVAFFVLNSHQAFAANYAASLPSDVYNSLQTYDNTSQTQLGALNQWVSQYNQPQNDGSNPATNTIPYTVGAAEVQLQLNHSIFFYHSLLTNPAIRFPNDGTPNAVANRDDIQNAVQIQNLNPVAGGGCVTSEIYDGSEANPCLPANGGGYPAGVVQNINYSSPGSTRYLNSGTNTPVSFYYVPQTGNFTPGNHSITLDLTYAEINTWPNNPVRQRYQCAPAGNYVTSSNDFAGCAPTTQPIVITFSVQPSIIYSGIDSGTTCDLSGWAFDTNDSSVTLNIDAYVNAPAGPGVPGFRYAPDNPDNGQPNAGVNYYFGIHGNHGFDINPQTDPFLEPYVNAGPTTVYLYAIGVSSSGALDGYNKLIGQVLLTPCSTTPPPNNPNGTASCVYPPSFDPKRLPWGPGDSAAVTVSVDYAPPNYSSGSPASDASYVTDTEDDQTTAVSPTITLTSPVGAGWNWSPTTKDVAGEAANQSLPSSTTVPNATGAFDVDWTFSWSVVQTSYTWNPPSAAFPQGGYTSTQTVLPQPTLSCNYPSSITSNGGPLSQAVEDYPYFRVYGGDISAGGTCSSTPSGSKGGIYGWPKEAAGTSPATWIGGAGTQFAESAIGVINGAASAANVSAGVNTATPDTPNGGAPTGLSFANWYATPAPGVTTTASSSGVYGGCSGGVDGATAATIASLYKVPTSAQALTTANTPSLATGMLDVSGLATNTYSVAAGVTIDNGGTMTIANGHHIVIYVNGDVIIKGNLVLGTPPWSSSDNIPSLWIIASGNIGIDSGVTRMDGVYVAAGNGSSSAGDIQTCYNVTPSVTATDFDTSGYYGTCKQPLTVNGSFIAAHDVYLQRTTGTVSDSSATDNGGSPAETVNFNPELYLPTQESVSSNYAAISSLPPTL